MAQYHSKIKKVFAEMASKNANTDERVKFQTTTPDVTVAPNLKTRISAPNC